MQRSRKTRPQPCRSRRKAAKLAWPRCKHPRWKGYRFPSGAWGGLAAPRSRKGVVVPECVTVVPNVSTELPIAVAMSGGVDSSTVAAMLVRQGRTVVGMTMQLWNQRRLPELAVEGGAPSGRCCSLDDVYDARRVAEQIGIPYYVVNFERQFEEQVVKPFVEEYLAGRTPIPCTLCNNYIKFDRFLEMADSVGAHYMATGHYARVRFHPATGRYQLLRAVDPSKDQTYFLFGLTQAELARTLFPLGDLNKPEVRDIARSMDLAVASKGDSQEICFVPNGDYAAFMRSEERRVGK